MDSTPASSTSSDVGPRLSNPWHEWVYMELKWRPSTHSKHVHVDLTINFADHWFPTALGRIKFGLCGGDLIVELKNGTMPIAARNPKNNLPLEVTVTREVTTTSKDRDANVKGTLGAKVGLTAVEPSVSLELGHKGGGEVVTRENLSVQKWTLKPKGSPSNPIWSFEVQDKKPILEGLLADYEIGTVVLDRKPCTLSAELKVARTEIAITGREGLLLSGLTRNKNAIATALVKKSLWKNLQPHVSSAEMDYV